MHPHHYSRGGVDYAGGWTRACREAREDMRVETAASSTLIAAEPNPRLKALFKQ
ncbi:hypothetical protein TCELL_1035 [Thermogladius calderae 1633]|uniref:Uncharacterized protein n=1 Tax=Thermogladius calderae (strain DSM 22663 / VKM B-2946 / 1633) TaxID=1184251 RepID=I3TFC0_THEC1|nr:hypothetical protein TCELL_1035 [Thermogladius calderae 1633]